MGSLMLKAHKRRTTAKTFRSSRAMNIDSLRSATRLLNDIDQLYSARRRLLKYEDHKSMVSVKIGECFVCYVDAGVVRNDVERQIGALYEQLELLGVER